MITTCEDCDKQTKVTLVGYGASYMAEINCPDCGVSYDTNLSEEDITYLRQENKMQTMKDLLNAIKPILPNALIIDTDEGIMIETNLQLGIGGLLEPIETKDK